MQRPPQIRCVHVRVHCRMGTWACTANTRVKLYTCKGYCSASTPGNLCVPFAIFRRLLTMLQYSVQRYSTFGTVQWHCWETAQPAKDVPTVAAIVAQLGLSMEKAFH